MDDVYIFRLVSIMAGVVGLAMSIGVLLIPQAVRRLERNLDKDFSTDHLEKVLNERKNLSEVLLRHPRIFGFILLAISFMLLLLSLLTI